MLTTRCLALLALAGLMAGSAGGMEAAPSFRNDVMALISRAGCNAGPCHGNANGKGGFKLSLRGEDPATDYEALTRDLFGRRINPLAPGESLLLQKATAAVAHEGGQRFDSNSPDYELLRQWIAHGAPQDIDTAPKVIRLTVTPTDEVLVEPRREIQIKATAHFSDGTERDVTATAVYESANTVVGINRQGLVQAHGIGETTVLVRYLEQQRPVRLAFVPARPDFQWQPLVAKNFVDEAIFAKLRTLRMNPSGDAGDATFLRRAYLDLLGVLPTPIEARTFLSSNAEGKRARLIDQLLERPEFADFWALKWCDLLRVEERSLDQKGVQAFHQWLRRGFANDKPLDQMTRELIAARGSTYTHPEANFYRAHRDPVSRAEAAAQVFLGTRLQCAQCHNHPFDRWTQADYYNWTALFAKVQYKVLENRRTDNNDSHEFKGEQVVYIARRGEVKHPRTGQAAQPAFLGQAWKKSGPGDELQALAAWLTRADNPFFARAQANRIWFHLMGRGLVDPLDDFRATNPASHPALLDRLATELASHRFSLRHLVRIIMNSQAYQLESQPNATNADDDVNYSHALVRRLGAEALLDCTSQVMGVPLKFTGFPRGTRAAQLPGTLPEKKRDPEAAGAEKFLEIFGKPPRLGSSECERSDAPSMGQAFQLVSGPVLEGFIAAPENRLATWARSDRSKREIIEELYWTALTRAPFYEELNRAEEHLAKSKNIRTGLEDLAWSLLNSKEFLFRK